MFECCSLGIAPKALVCGIGPDCRERVPWNATDADLKTFNRAFEAFAMHATPLPNPPNSQDLKSWVLAIVDNQCKLMQPQPTAESKQVLQSAVVEQCDKLSAGCLYHVNGQERHVTLSLDWKALDIQGEDAAPLKRLSSIQLDTTWQSFNMTLVFELRRSGNSFMHTFSFDQLSIRVRFALTVKVLRHVTKRRHRKPKSSSLRSDSKSSVERKISGSSISKDQQSDDDSEDMSVSPSKSSSKLSGFALRENQGSDARSSRPSNSNCLFSERTLRVGSQVVIHGLKESIALNGESGICQKWDDTTERWHIRLKTGDMISVKPQNLNVVDAASQPDENSCTICLDARAEMAFVPCGHQCLCIACAEGLSSDMRTTCPQCRQRASDIIRIFR